MPYFIYKVFEKDGEKDGEKTLEYVGEHGAFIKAKTQVRAMRAELPSDAGYTVRITFAADRAEAEAQLKEKREPPILKEWEK